MEGEVKGSTFKMKGHTLPGINQRSGGNKSSAFQQGGMGTAGNMAQTVQPNLGVQPPIPPPTGGVGAVGGTGATGGVLTSKPSMAKIYKKPKGKRTEY